MTPETMLLRQIHPMYFSKDGEILRGAFKPTNSDNGFLSVYNGDMIEPAPAVHHYREQGRKTGGVAGITVEECSRHQLPCIDDGVPFPEHATIDFSKKSPSEMKKAYKELTIYANNRGLLAQV